jgi:hypothetical protein
VRQTCVLRARDRAAWQSVLDRCQAYDVYHTSEYHCVAESCGEGEARLFVYDDGRDVAAFPYLYRQIDALAWAQGSPRADASSVYGYAGPVSSAAAGASELALAFQDALRAHLVAERVVALFSRLHPILRNEWLVDEMADIGTVGRTVSIVLHPDRDMLAGMSTNHRRDIRRAMREGVTVTHDEHFGSLAQFHDAYEETMRRNGAATRYFFSFGYFRQLRDMLGSRCRLLQARDADGSALCWVLVLACGNMLQYHLSATPSRAVSRSAIKFVLYKIAVWGAACGYRWLHLGGGLGATEDDGLFRFKRGFSADTHEFRVLRLCVDSRAYEELRERRAKWIEAQGGRSDPLGHFPAYRAPP